MVLLLTVPSSGCLATLGEQDAGGSPAGVVSPPVFEPYVALPHDRPAAEPSVAVLGDGTVFLTAPAGGHFKPSAVEGAGWLWRSSDGGSSWETLRSPEVTGEDPALGRGAICSCDVDVATSPDGWVYYSDWWLGPGPSNFLVEASSDGGATWQKAPVSNLIPANVDRQWLLAGQAGMVAVFYGYLGLDRVSPEAERTPSVGSQSIKAVFSPDHGQTWGPPVSVVPGKSGWDVHISHPMRLADGTLMMPYGAIHTSAGTGEDLTSPSEVRVAVSTNGGATWDQVKVADAPEGFDNLWAIQGAADAAGNAYVVWAARTGATVTLHVAESGDGGRSWSKPTKVRSKGINVMPWITARGEGQVATGWYGGNATGDPRSADADARWYAYVAERAMPNGTWAVSRVTGDPVKIGPFCPLGGTCDEDRELLDFLSLAYGPDGLLHYGFARSHTATDGQLRSVVTFAREVGTDGS